MSLNPRQGCRAKSAKVAKQRLQEEQSLDEEIIEGLTELVEVVPQRTRR